MAASTASGRDPSSSLSPSSPFVTDDESFGRPKAPAPPEHPPLAIDDVGRVNRQGQVRGMLTGFLGGISAALIVRNLMRRGPNATLLTGLGVGAGVGYVAGFVHVRDGLNKLEQRERTRYASRRRPDDDEMQKLDMQAGQNPSFEAGVAGMYDLRDRTHATRGDH